ncbi:MAG TPA: MarR family transcriptional regulator [Acidimicrobiales bacterium]|nr:MarR family transcriptional regulator [Acidimicrobiales bacterium]
MSLNSRPLPFDAIAEARRQWESHGWKGASAMATVTSIMRAQQIVLARVDAVLRPLDLTFARYEALVLLFFSRNGSLPMGKMGSRLMLHPTSVTNIIDRLEDQGLVRRASHPTDRRTTLAEITDEGRKVVEAATEATSEISLGMGNLTDGDLDRITDLLRHLRVDAGDFPE